MITRITGIAAMVGLVSVTMFGVMLAARLGNYRSKAKRRLHRRLSWLVLALVGVHITAALLDRHHVPPSAVVVPFLSPVRTVAVGTGSLALWGLLLVALTVAGRRWLKRSWRLVHYVAYPAAGLALVHSLLGSDRVRLVAAVMLGVAVVVVRSMYLGRHRRRVRPPAESTGPAPDAWAGPWGRPDEDSLQTAPDPNRRVTVGSDEAVSGR
jgi:DMSO/TMAO reductase YedYZ heme-binding membrane subunit